MEAHKKCVNLHKHAKSMVRRRHKTLCTTHVELCKKHKYCVPRSWAYVVHTTWAQVYTSTISIALMSAVQHGAIYIDKHAALHQAHAHQSTARTKVSGTALPERIHVLLML